VAGPGSVRDLPGGPLMGIYRVMVTSRLEEVFEIDAADEEEAARDWFDGALVSSYAGDVGVEWVEKVE